jgi:hypothetical protein
MGKGRGAQIKPNNRMKYEMFSLDFVAEWGRPKGTHHSTKSSQMKPTTMFPKKASSESVNSHFSQKGRW